MMGPLPPDIELGGSWQVRFTALDPTTGAVVGGVVIAQATIQVESLTAAGLRALESAAWQLVPERGP